MGSETLHPSFLNLTLGDPVQIPDPKNPPLLQATGYHMGPGQSFFGARKLFVANAKGKKIFPLFMYT